MDPATDADTYETKLIDGDIVILFVSSTAPHEKFPLKHGTTSDRRAFGQCLPHRVDLDMFTCFTTICTLTAAITASGQN